LWISSARARRGPPRLIEFNIKILTNLLEIVFATKNGEPRLVRYPPNTRLSDSSHDKNEARESGEQKEGEHKKVLLPAHG
jgi:hypothetical protein